MFALFLYCDFWSGHIVGTRLALDSDSEGYIVLLAESFPTVISALDLGDDIAELT